MFAENYGHPIIHRRMLRDRVRCEAYKKAITAAVKPGAIVADMGTGTGILAIFAAKAGASKVYAVEPTSTIELAREMVKRNGVQDRVQLIQDHMETVELPAKVDIMLSEWIGSCGDEENLLTGVLTARDKWLKPGGTLLPETVSTWIAIVEDRPLIGGLDLWRSYPYGVDLSIIADRLTNEIMFADYDITPRDFLAEPFLCWTHNAYTAVAERVRRPWSVTTRFRARRAGMLSALAAWFDADVGFNNPLTNAPGKPKTHWRPVIMPLAQPQPVSEGAAIEVQYTLTPSGKGYCDSAWKVRIGEGYLEQHDSSLLTPVGPESNAFTFVYPGDH